MAPSLPSTLHLSPNMPLQVKHVWEVACQSFPLSLDKRFREHFQPAKSLLEDRIAAGDWIYGYSSGFGPLARFHVSPEADSRLQQGLIYHLATGVGPAFESEVVRAIMFTRLGQLLKGHSGIDIQLPNLLAACLNVNLLPIIPSLGTVGASGDLTPLAHMALGLMGETDVCYKGVQKSGLLAFEASGLKPWQPKGREALALVNGTAAMTALAALNDTSARTALSISQLHVLIMGEVLEAYKEAWHPGIAEVRPHPGQIAVSNWLWEASASSNRLTPLSRSRWKSGSHKDAHPRQDAYTLRCAPQVLGAVWDICQHHGQVVSTELNAVSDNPVLLPEKELLLHGGNFNGQHISFVSDYLQTGIVQMAVYAERRFARLTHPSLQDRLPAFLQSQRLGAQSGFMGAQVTTSALVARMRSQAHPSSIQSISTNGDNQDIVSMGTLAALRTREQLDHLYDILAIEGIGLVQAMDLVSDGEWEGFSEQVRQYATRLRKVVPCLQEDRPLAPDQQNWKKVLRTHPKFWVTA
ncbi:MAG: aromatic amino acid ammonia-lyase [Bacteroidota bacterium]